MTGIDSALKAQFTETLVKTGRKLRTRFNAEVVRHGLTYPRARALAVLAGRGPLRQGELAGELELEGPTVVRLLDGMEKLGLVERRSVDGDRRAKQVALTAHGHEQAALVSAISARIRDVVLARSEVSDITAALGVLAEIGAAIDGDFGDEAGSGSRRRVEALADGR
ncbi:MarR family winged helix-turn-helix transcriptional regulator [Aureimonas sp. AU12]|uniref:MarR family winged helix-turn-helix transcriptional regulator n=1 Tax=Aureimonas sp. AU12 TaxID=1638161 RepID=UPI0007063154|nr:MarR family transcriptional regulator [Aureimonas sp. AU12]BAT29693.1 transcriptional regulator [Aureimonas sp. AU12]